MNEVIRFLCSVVVHATVVMMTFSFFKIRLVENHKQIAVLSLLIGGANYLVRYQLESMMYLPVSLIVFIMSLMIIRRYPIAYSILVALSGYVIGAFIDELITYQFMIVGNISLQELLDSKLIFIASNAAAAIACTLIALLFRWREWGTSFIVSRFHGKYALRKNNYIWAIILVAGLLTVQLGITSSLEIYHVVALSVFCLFAIVFTYRENKKILKVRFPGKYKEGTKH